ncbi:MAG: alpha,alpha-trehalase TreA [Chitinophagaceae bacterium]
MGKQFLLLLSYSLFIIKLPAQTPATPDKIYGKLFHEVQMSRIFPDSKIFVDCVPKKAPAEIVANYQKIISNPAIRFSLKIFTEENFELPVTPQLNYITKEKDIVMHIKNLWPVLKRNADSVTAAGGSSLLPLPRSYIVPGGRFREVYYWDAYFTMLGLKESGETELIENMVMNFAYLIDSFGHVPNGNRSYYLSRSQPPFFSLMVELLAAVKGDAVYLTYLPQLEKEYQYWMEGNEKLKALQSNKAIVKLKDGSLLNRYWDDLDLPRQEAYYEDQTLSSKYPDAKAKKINRDLRAAAASGWDFSSRWFADKKNLSSIQTTSIIPVDLNCLMYKLELTIARAKLLKRDDNGVAAFRKKAADRLNAIDKYCWNKAITFYTDYNFVTQKQSAMVTPAGMYPFCFFDQKLGYMSLLARRVAVVIKTKLLKAGGIVTTENNTGQQWDAPNGWAPLQWMTIWGLDRGGQKELARDIAERWLKLNMEVFNRTGKLMEKYNVTDTKTDAGGGEYPGQDGFGWTNGVFLKLAAMYGLPK